MTTTTISRFRHDPYTGHWYYCPVLLLFVICIFGDQSDAWPVENIGSSVCGKIHTSENNTVTFIDGAEISIQDYGHLQIQKLKNAVISPEKGCVLNICGYTYFGKDHDDDYVMDNDEYRRCDQIDRQMYAPDEPYNERFNVSSVGCGCQLKVEDCVDSCSEQLDRLQWKDNDCAYLYGESNCNSCYFRPHRMVSGQRHSTNYSHAILSVIVKKHCNLNHAVPGFQGMWDKPIDIDYAGPIEIAEIKFSVFQSAPETYFCSCIENTNVQPEQQNQPTSSHFEILFIIALAIYFLFPLLLIGCVRICRKKNVVSTGWVYKQTVDTEFNNPHIDMEDDIYEEVK